MERIEMTLSCGKRIDQSGDPLDVVNVGDLTVRIRTDEQLAADITQLRRVRSLGVEAYRRLKIRLPYCVAAAFNPAVRQSANLVAATGLFLDIDQCPDGPQKLKTILAQDERAALIFVSPSGQGLKVLFKLAQPIAHTKQYSDYYRQFAHDFARQYDLAEGLDLRTSDATRACFLSSDPEAFFRPDPVPLEGPAPGLFDLPEDGTSIAETGPENPLSPAVYRQVMEKLGARPRRPQPGPILVPEPLERFEAAVKTWMEARQLTLPEVRNIQYGKCFALQQEFKRAEVNVYYGKSGFSVIPTAKRGCDPELTQILAATLEAILLDAEI